VKECTSCHAEVVFVKSATSGRVMILNARPVSSVVLRNDLGETAPPDDPAASAHVVPVYTDHHATCSRAKEWRGRSRRNPPPADADSGRRGD